MSVSGLIFLLIWGLLIVLVLVLIWHIDQMKCTIIKTDSIVTITIGLVFMLLPYSQLALRSLHEGSVDQSFLRITKPVSMHVHL